VTFLHISLWIAQNSRVFHRKTAKAYCISSFCGKHIETCGKHIETCGKPGQNLGKLNIYDLKPIDLQEVINS
jgi:hypothetical protein